MLDESNGILIFVTSFLGLAFLIARDVLSILNKWMKPKMKLTIIAY